MADYISSGLTEDEKNAWATPQWLFDALHNEFIFHLDVAASENNKKCYHFIDINQDALKMDNWVEAMSGYKTLAHRAVWCNPPYSRGMIKAFMEKAYQQCRVHKITVVLLVPATVDAGWWPANATEIRLITQGRISFQHPITKKPINGNTKGSAIVIFKHSDLDYPTVTRYIKRDKLRELGEGLNNQQGGKNDGSLLQKMRIDTPAQSVSAVV